MINYGLVDVKIYLVIYVLIYFIYILSYGYKLLIIFVFLKIINYICVDYGWFKGVDQILLYFLFY